MSLKKPKHKTLIVLFLELLSLSPVFMILGNVIPPFPMKVHFITFGLTFLLVCLFIIQYQSKKWILYIALLYFFLQFFLSGFFFKDFVDFFFGPFVFLSLIDLLFNNRVSKATLWKYQKRFFILMWAPMIISVLQFLEVFPLTFWNATYINYSIVEGLKTPRVNGFLYHGSELSVVILFVAVKQLISKQKYFFPTSLFILLIAYSTYYKALTATVLLMIVYYYSIINPLKIFSWTKGYFIKDKLLYQTLSLATILSVLFLVYKIQIQEVKELFEPQLLTGRGAIWNVYLQAIKDFSLAEWLFGAGIGSEPLLFKQYATPELYFPLHSGSSGNLTPDAHNALLSAFLNAGIIGVLLYIFLFKLVHSQMKLLKEKSKARATYFLIFIFAIITIGITIPIFKNAIYWIALSFIVYNWFIQKNIPKDEA
ncbi:MAG: O-antigen ligase family protein [Vicingaceae bacterium]